MSVSRHERFQLFLTCLCVSACWLCAFNAAPARAAAEGEEPTASVTQELAWQLIARHANEADRLVGSPFGRPISLKSQAKEGVAEGEAIAEMKVALPVLRTVLGQPQRWCEILLLTPSIAGCASTDGGIDARFDVKLLYHYDQSEDEASKATFRFQRRLSDSRYLWLQLTAPRGPLGTSDYRLDVEATSLDSATSVLRVKYAYRFGVRAAAVMGVYLATSGREKIGFSQNAQGRPVGGLRGSIERNVMRYFLAIEAHVLQDAADPSQRFEESLAQWLTAVDHYPEHLAERDPEHYRRIKLAQFETTR